MVSSNIIYLLVVICFVGVSARTVQDPRDVEQIPDEVLGQSEPSIMNQEFETEDGQNQDSNQDLVRLPRQPQPYDELVAPWMLENPSGRTIHKGISIGLTPPAGLFPSILPMAHSYQAPPMPMPMPMPCPSCMPEPIHYHQPPPIPYQSVPYISGYSMTPIYGQKQIPLSPPCPYHHDPYTMPMPPMMPSQPQIVLSKNIGFGRSSEQMPAMDPYYYPPHYHLARAAEQQAAYSAVDPSNLMIGPLPPPDSMPKFKRASDADILSNVIPE